MVATLNESNVGSGSLEVVPHVEWYRNEGNEDVEFASEVFAGRTDDNKTGNKGLWGCEVNEMLRNMAGERRALRQRY